MAGAKMNGGLVIAAAAATTSVTIKSLSFPNFRLPLLRTQVGPLTNVSPGLLSPGYNPQYAHLQKKNKKYLLSPCKLRAALVGGGTWLHDAGATALVVSGAYALVSAFDYLTQRNLIQQGLSRKLVHILSGLLFMASWPIFSTSTRARYFASLVPLLNCIRLVVYGLSLATDEGLIKSVTREGKPEELLRGPLYYVVILIVCAIVFWLNSPVGIVSVSMMCGGDGIADIMGRRFGSTKLPYNHNKSWAGSISMFVFGFLVSIGMLYYFSALGYFEFEWNPTIQRVALVSLVATFVESLPTAGKLDDNISVPLASMVTAFLSFGY